MAVDLPGNSGRPAWDEVRRTARGQRKDYRLEARHLAIGGQAAVFRGRHKSTGLPIAFKRLIARDESSIARMRREIEAAQRFGDGRLVMPVLDADPDHTWFVMPLASDTATTLAADLTDPVRLRELVTTVCEALRPAHAEGWVHRDLKPDNILRLDGQWVVADWGLGRRPRGRTSDQRRTAAGVRFGTDGFAAPELSVSAHEVGPQADVFSIGQLIGWALTGEWPLANVPRLPAPGPWRTIVRDATAFDPAQRPADCAALLALIVAELDVPADSAIAEGRRLLAAAAGGDAAAPAAIMRLAAGMGTDQDLFDHVVAELDEDQLLAAVATDRESVRAVVRGVGDLSGGAGWLVMVAMAAARTEDWDLLRDAADSVLRLGDEPDREATLVWLRQVSGAAAQVAAAAVRARQDARAWLAGLGDDKAVDPQVRRAVRQATARSRQQAPRPSAVPAPVAPHRGRGRRGTLAGALAAVTAAGVLWWVNQDDTAASGNGGNPTGTSTTTTVREPSKQAATPQLRDFAAPWDAYPNWVRCLPGAEGTSVDGTFPAAPDTKPLRPTHTFFCDNGGNFTVLFAEILGLDHAEALTRYRAAPPPRSPAYREEQPPEGLHVFQWSDTQRALVWSDERTAMIGIAITDSEGTDLVELWEKYQT